MRWSKSWGTLVSRMFASTLRKKASLSHKYAFQHSCWRAWFLAFCLGGRPAIYTRYIPYISFIYSMYIYNYMHVWRAARNVRDPPANNYAFQCICFSRHIVVHFTFWFKRDIIRMRSKHLNNVLVFADLSLFISPADSRDIACMRAFMSSVVQCCRCSRNIA